MARARCGSVCQKRAAICRCGSTRSCCVTWPPIWRRFSALPKTGGLYLSGRVFRLLGLLFQARDARFQSVDALRERAINGLQARQWVKCVRRGNLASVRGGKLFKLSAGQELLPHIIGKTLLFQRLGERFFLTQPGFQRGFADSQGLLRFREAV